MFSGEEDHKFHNAVSEQATEDEVVEMLLRNGQPSTLEEEEDDEDVIFNVRRDR